MNEEIKEFIEQNIHLIEDNRWDEIYDNATYTLDMELTGLLTLTMLNAGIDPIVVGQLDYVPEDFLSCAKLDKYIVPEGIHEVGYGAFSHCSIDSIVLPETLERIEEVAFFFSNVKEITVPEKCKYIHVTAFDGCYATILCKKGSIAETFAKSQNMEIRYY